MKEGILPPGGSIDKRKGVFMTFEARFFAWLRRKLKQRRG